ncbi:MAG: GNAT family N-acetyltransferase [Thermoplasmataceae archaeon]
MEIQNVKMDWNLILEPQIRHFEEVYSDLPVRESMRPIISQLNENRIPSRVILSSLDVAGYAFVINGTDMPDRSYGNVGFSETKYVNERRIETLIGWVEQIAFGNRRIAMINPVFNDNGLSESFLEERGYSKRVRKKLYLDIPSKEITTGKLPLEISALDLSRLDIFQYSRSQSEAYKNTLDEIMFPRSETDRVSTLRKIFDGQYGEPIYEASRILVKNGRIISAIVVTQGSIRKNGERIPLVVDLFTLPEFRGNGLGTWLLSTSIEALQRLGFHQVELWVTEGNNAEALYRNLGFKYANYPREVFYFRAQ